jgi:hypothetical protein
MKQAVRSTTKHSNNQQVMKCMYKVDLSWESSCNVFVNTGFRRMRKVELDNSQFTINMVPPGDHGFQDKLGIVS